jgi:hypothetical protein
MPPIHEVCASQVHDSRYAFLLGRVAKFWRAADVTYELETGKGWIVRGRAQCLASVTIVDTFRFAPDMSGSVGRNIQGGLSSTLAIWPLSSGVAKRVNYAFAQALGEFSAVWPAL